MVLPEIDEKEKDPRQEKNPGSINKNYTKAKSLEPEDDEPGVKLFLGNKLVVSES